MHDTGFCVPSAQRHRLVTPYRHATEGEGMAPGLFYTETEQDNRHHHQGEWRMIGHCGDETYGDCGPDDDFQAAPIWASEDFMTWRKVGFTNMVS